MSFQVQKIDKISGKVVAQFDGIRALAQHLGRGRTYSCNILEHNGGHSSNYVYRVPAKASQTDREHLKKHFIKEGWAYIPGFEGYIAHKSGKVANSLTGRILKGRVNYHGYLRVSLQVRNDQKSIGCLMRVSRIITSTFLDDYKNFPEVHHINGDKLDNQVENLQCVTSQ